MYKQCTKCKETKHLDEYTNHNKGKMGKRSACRVCTNEDKKIYRDSNKDKIADYMKQYWKSNPGAKRASKAQRRAIEKQATVAWADSDLIKEYYFAANFLSMVTGEWHHVDHIVPLVNDLVCGLHTQDNMQVLTAADNISKNNRFTIQEY